MPEKNMKQVINECRKVLDMHDMAESGLITADIVTDTKEIITAWLSRYSAQKSVALRLLLDQVFCELEKEICASVKV